jgi:hypothetical protein
MLYYDVKINTYADKAGYHFTVHPNLALQYVDFYCSFSVNIQDRCYTCIHNDVLKDHFRAVYHCGQCTSYSEWESRPIVVEKIISKTLDIDGNLFLPRVSIQYGMFHKVLSMGARLLVLFPFYDSRRSRNGDRPDSQKAERTFTLSSGQ